MKNNKCFEMNYLTLPLPFDNMFANERHFERIVLDETSESLVDTISCLYILLYRYCYKTPFPIILIETTKKIQFYLQKHDVTYSEMKYEIEHEIGLGKNTLINEELQVVFTKDIKVDNFIRKFSHLVLLFNITERNDKTFVTELYYNKIVFYETTIKRLIENLYYLKKQVKSNNNININYIDIVSQDEKKLIETFNYKECDWNIHQTYMDFFYKHFSDYLSFNALQGKNITFTYEALNNISNYYAEKLLKTEGNYVGIYLKDDIATVIGILSILKAGKIIVAINPTYPPKRIEYIVNSLDITTILTCSKTKMIIDENISIKNNIVIYPNENTQKEIANVYCKVNTEDLCYVIFTSGTTGTPKGVKITQENIMIELNFFRKYFDITPHQKALHILNYSFDFGLYDILSTILYGGCLYILEKNEMKNFKNYISFINEKRINFINTTPSFFNILASFNIYMPSLKYVHLGGEKVTYQMIRNYIKVISKECNIYNGYGPCECTVGTNIYKVSYSEKYEAEEKYSSVPIGIPTDNSYIYVLDENMLDVPINCLGELFIAGESLGVGYIDETMDAEKFINVYTKNNLRMYRTGDLVRWLGTGNVEFIGRIDNQVKINGFRIELSEIDNVILKNECIDEVKTICNSSNGNNILVTFIKIKKQIEISEIRKYISQYLPYYMIPTRYVIIDEFPYLASGKIDVKKLILIQD